MATPEIVECTVSTQYPPPSTTESSASTSSSSSLSTNQSVISESTTPSSQYKHGHGVHDAASVQAVELLSDNRFAEAKALLAPTRNRNPRHSLHCAEADLMLSIVLGHKKELSACLATIKRTIAITEDCIDNFSDRAVSAGVVGFDADSTTVNAAKDDLHVVLADANMISAVIHIYLDELLKAGWRLKKAWTLYKALFTRKSPALSPELVDCVHFGCGLFMFALSWLPPVVITILEAVGFRSDRAYGVQLLTEASEGTGLRSFLSSVALLANLLLIPRALVDVSVFLDAAKPVVERSLYRWPHSSVMHWMASFYTRKSGDYDGGLAHMDAAISSLSEISGGEYHAPGTLLLDKATCLLMARRWSDAADLCKGLSGIEGSGVRGMAQAMWAMSEQMAGNTEEALRLIRSMPPEKSLIGRDKLSLDIAQRCLHRQSLLTIFPFELLYLRRDLAHMRPDALRPLLYSLEKSYAPFRGSGSREEEALYKLIHGHMLRTLGDIAGGTAELAEAAAASTVQSRPFKREVYVAAFATCELAELAYQRGELKETERLLAIAGKNANSGPWQDLIKPRMRVALEQLRVEMHSGKRPTAKTS